MDRNQAITHLRSQGFEVFERSWSLGNTIGVGALPETHDGIRTFKALEYLYPVEGGRWGVTDLRNNGRGSEHADLPSAVEAIALVVGDQIGAKDTQ